jgi:pimeloyl-ACP methyl ester carboxylesterase
MKKNLTLSILLISFLCFSQNNENGVLFIKSLLQEKDYEKAYSFFDDAVKSQLTQKSLEDTAQQLEGELGKFKSIIEIHNEKETTAYYYSDFENVKLDIKISFNTDKKIIGFFFVPHREFYKEGGLGQSLNIKSNDIELKGTLLLPETGNLKKLILFVHGSGPNDRDETIAENKPFRDIAESLYAKGIASYRFDKRTLSNPESFNEKSTIDDEVTNDVINIIHYFKQDTQFKDYEITILGHSLGAYLLPRIANESGQIAKIILMAGNARPLEELVLEQYNYLYQASPTPEMKDALKKIEEQIETLHSKMFSLITPTEKLPLNLSAYYWKSLLEYNPIKEIQKTTIPILILQGERDYQVSMKDFELWKISLKNNPKTTLLSYPKLNHLFMTGEKPSEPSEYLVKGKVDAGVIDDISHFIVEK